VVDAGTSSFVEDAEALRLGGGHDIGNVAVDHVWRVGVAVAAISAWDIVAGLADVMRSLVHVPDGFVWVHGSGDEAEELVNVELVILWAVLASPDREGDAAVSGHRSASDGEAVGQADGAARVWFAADAWAGQLDGDDVATCPIAVQASTGQVTDWLGWAVVGRRRRIIVPASWDPLTIWSAFALTRSA